jgi:hypothetical protein
MSANRTAGAKPCRIGRCLWVCGSIQQRTLCQKWLSPRNGHGANYLEDYRILKNTGLVSMPIKRAYAVASGGSTQDTLPDWLEIFRTTKAQLLI